MIYILKLITFLLHALLKHLDKETSDKCCNKNKRNGFHGIGITTCYGIIANNWFGLLANNWFGLLLKPFILFCHFFLF